MTFLKSRTEPLGTVELPGKILLITIKSLTVTRSVIPRSDSESIFFIEVTCCIFESMVQFSTCLQDADKTKELTALKQKYDEKRAQLKFACIELQNKKAALAETQAKAQQTAKMLLESKTALSRLKVCPALRASGTCVFHLDQCVNVVCFLEPK